MYTLNRHIRDCSLSLHGTDISIKKVMGLKYLLIHKMEKKYHTDSKIRYQDNR